MFSMVFYAFKKNISEIENEGNKKLYRPFMECIVGADKCTNRKQEKPEKQ